MDSITLKNDELNYLCCLRHDAYAFLFADHQSHNASASFSRHCCRSDCLVCSGAGCGCEALSALTSIVPRKALARALITDLHGPLTSTAAARIATARAPPSAAMLGPATSLAISGVSTTCVSWRSWCAYAFLLHRCPDKQKRINAHLDSNYLYSGINYCSGYIKKIILFTSVTSGSALTRYDRS